MIQHIEKLFEENKTIIIPGLGALTITNPDTGELMFMPYLKHDDGMLANAIATAEGIATDDAKTKIAAEVADILAKVEAGTTVPFGKFGHFLNDLGDVGFENAEEESAATEESAPEPPSEPEIVPEPEATPEPEIQEEPVAEEMPEPETTPEVIVEETVNEPAAEEPTIEEPTVEEPVAEQHEAEEPIVEKPQSIADEFGDEAPETEEETKIISEALEATSMHSEKEEQPETEAPTKTIAEEIAETEAKRTLTPEETPTKADIPKEDPKPAVVKEKIPVIPTPKTPKKELNILEKEEIAANQKKLDALKANKSEGKKKRKRGVGFYILISLVVLLAAGGTYVGLNYDQVKEYIPFLAEDSSDKNKGDEEVEKMREMVGEEPDTADETDTEPSETVEVSEPDTEIDTQETEVVVETPVEKPKKTTPPANTGSNNQPFHIVAGVFSSAENAERLAEKIRGMGYPAKTFARGNQTVVSVKSYATSAEANAALPSVQDAAPKGWVLEWRN